MPEFLTHEIIRYNTIIVKTLSFKNVRYAVIDNWNTWSTVKLEFQPLTTDTCHYARSVAFASLVRNLDVANIFTFLHYIRMQ